MNETESILQPLDPDEKKAFEEIMDYCKARVTSDEGIPAIIALDDLTDTDRSFYTPAKSDEGMNLILARAAMQFTDLYERRKADVNYPAIAFAMSAAAEKYFRAERSSDGSLKTISYSDVVDAFIKKHDA